MQKIKCEMCGSGDFIKQDGFHICQYCGTKYPDTDNETNNSSVDNIQNCVIPNKCPICGEKDGWILLDNSKKGFSAGKALLGGAIFGPIGLVAGAFGKKTYTFYCKKCGFKHDYKN